VQNAGPAGLALGPDGNLWFADASWYAGVGMVTPSGAATEWSDGQSGSVPDYIATGPDGNMWFTDHSLPAIWKVTLPTSRAAVTGCRSAATGSGSSPGGGSSSGSGTALGAKGDLAPKLIYVRESHTRWREPGAKPAGAPVGTTFTFALNAKAIVRFTFMRRVPGVAGPCRAATHANRNHGSCRRSVESGVSAIHGLAGCNRVVFQGRLGHGLRLPPGSYAVQITATNAGGRSALRTLTCLILG
jgi:hypothetical protein